MGGALFSVFMSGGPKEGSLGIFLLIAGLVLLLSRSLVGVSGWLWMLAGGMVLTGCASFLPQAWFPLPEWRSALAALPALHLPESVTLQPWATGFWVLLLGISMLLALRTLASPLSRRGMERAALVVVIGCAGYAVMAWAAWQTGWKYPFFEKPDWAQPAFGFFHNRNHTAGFLLTGAIVSLGLIHRGMNGGRMLPAVLGACALAIISASLLFFSQSRGGMLFLMTGTGIWIAGLGRHRSRRLLAGSFAILLILLLLFVASGSGLLERLKGNDPVGDVPPAAEVTRPGEARADARISIMRDTLGIIADYPVTGTGMGTYALIYPFYAKKSLCDRMRAIHSESDWLMLCSEAGIPSLLLAVVAVFLLCRRLPGLRDASGGEWPLRWAFLSAFLAELLHGFVDVPLHQPALGWWVMLLGALGFGNHEAAPVGSLLSRLLARTVLIAAGLAAIVLGAVLVLAQWGGGMHSPAFSEAAAEKRILSLYESGGPDSISRAIAACDEALLLNSVSSALHHQAGILAINKDGNPARAESSFEAAQALSVIDPALPFEEGRLIASADPLKAADYWNEALRRQLEMDRSPNSPIWRSPDLFGSMMEAAKGNPTLLGRMPALASYEPNLRFRLYTHPSCDPLLIGQAVRDDAFMAQLTPRQQGQLIEIWWRRGDWPTVTAFLNANPHYERQAVITRARELAAIGDHRAACIRLMETFGITPPKSQAGRAPALRGAESDLPTDPLAAAKYYIEHGNVVAARRLLAEAQKGGGGAGSAGEALLLRAQLEMSQERWKEALDPLISYLQVSGRL